MKKSLITLAIAAAIAAPMTVSAAEAKFFGYSQITANYGNGNTLKAKEDNDGLAFGLDRVRLGYKIKQGKAWGKLQVDFNKEANKRNAAIIKDAVVGYKISNAANISLGQFKTPVGMDFNTSGKKLDITKRGMEKSLVLERAAGAMISGRKISGFGYDLGLFNPAGRSKAGANGSAGDGIAYAGRVMFDMGKALHVEASYGIDGADTPAAGMTAYDYSVMSVAGSYTWQDLTFKAEYVAGTNVGGVDGADETVWYIHTGYAINNMFEIVGRYYDGTQDRKSGVGSSMSNSYFGVNAYLAENKYNARVQLNYVLADASTDATGAAYYSGVSKGYTEDVVLAQFQVGF